MTVVIADDQERERIWLKELLNKHLSSHFPLYEAADGNEAVKLALAHKPQIVFLDIDMPGLSGIKAAEKIVTQLPQTGIIILSHHCDEIWVRELWKVMPSDGAFGYVLKDASDEQIIASARAVLDGDCSIHPHIQKIVRRSETGPSSLTEGEFEVLMYVSVGLTDKGIAKRLYVTEKAIQARLKCLYTKLGIPIKGDREDEINRRCRAMNIAVRRGLINKAELEELESTVQDLL